jgi:hypothetical protein
VAMARRFGKVRVAGATTWTSAYFWDGRRRRRVCVLTCLLRWSDRENCLEHASHWNGLSPVCDRMWRASSSDRENRQAQSFQSQPNGFSPVWRR